MKQYRVTKYDPILRDDRGAYVRAEWTEFSDIGYSFNGAPLTEAEYLSVENAYIVAASEFFRESGVSSLVVRGLENHRQAEVAFDEGDNLSLEQVSGVLSRMLRGDFWCKLEGNDSFIHVGHDYYMYLGVPMSCPKAEQLAVDLGLFVEPFQSPYGDADTA